MHAVTLGTLCTITLTGLGARHNDHGEWHHKTSEVKARCLALLDDMSDNHREFVVTKHDREVARLVRVERAPSTLRSVTLLAEDDDAYYQVAETWASDR